MDNEGALTKELLQSWIDHIANGDAFAPREQYDIVSPKMYEAIQFTAVKFNMSIDETWKLLQLAAWTPENYSSGMIDKAKEVATYYAEKLYENSDKA